MVRDSQGRRHRLPRYFYEIPSWEVARETVLAPGFGLYEFIHVDLYEARALHHFPRYVPCAITLLAAHLAVVRHDVDTYVHIAANGGYRSPSHAHTTPDTLDHACGLAADLYRVGDDFLDTPETLADYAARIEALLPGTRTLPADATRDHLHLSLGYGTLVPPYLP